MLTPRRLILAFLGVLLLAVAWSAWTAWQTARDLRDAEDAATRLQAAVESGDDVARDAAVEDLRDAAASAKDRTDGWWWAGMTKVPVYGDDLAGVEALSASVDLVARDAVEPLAETLDSLDGIVADGRIDPARVAALGEPVDRASRALSEGADLVAAHDSADFVSALRTRYDDYAERIEQISTGFEPARTAIEVLPGMLGGDGPRHYLFVFQNNAEARSTGGLPGSWALVNADDGRLEIVEQGNATDFYTDKQEAELTPEERAVYDQLPALFFQDANFIPDFPRVADIFDDFWRATHSGVELDGVLALDPVGMSYLMAGTGPVTAGPLTLTPDTIVAETLNNTYLTVPRPGAQDRRFQEVARALFAATTAQLTSPVDFVKGAQRAIDEGRLLVAPFDAEERERLAGTPITGALTGDDGATPHVDIGVNDSTGSKMSYYLRYDADVQAQSCTDGVQQLAASVTLNQTLSRADAKALPDTITGGGYYGIPAGTQLVALRVYGPYGGTIENVRVDGEKLLVERGLEIDGRPVVTVAPLIEGTDDVVVTWEMSTGAGQSGTGELGVTPGVEPGDPDKRFASAC